MLINKQQAKQSGKELWNILSSLSWQYFRHHQIIGLGFAFIIALIESLPLLGTLVPGSITMTALGALVGAGVLPPLATFLCTFLGAMCGDCLGFWLGWRYRGQIRSVWPFNKMSRYLTYARKFFCETWW